MLGVVALDRTIDLQLTAGDGTVFDTIGSVDEGGDLIVYGHDVWATRSPVSATGTFDHWVVVHEEDKDFVLLQLLRERFLEGPAPSAEFMSWLDDHAIPHEVGSPAGERRGEARLRIRAHRRNGTRSEQPSSNGPINGP